MVINIRDKKHASTHADGGSDEIATALNWKSLPLGTILMWSGAIADIPEGWQLCDGTNGTPDLRDRFIVGAGNNYSVGDTGGEETHTLTIDEIPSHTHTKPSYNDRLYNETDHNDVSKVASGGSAAASSATLEMDFTGGGQAHENRPPYYALCFIMRVAS